MKGGDIANSCAGDGGGKWLMVRSSNAVTSKYEVSGFQDANEDVMAYSDAGIRVNA